MSSDNTASLAPPNKASPTTNIKPNRLPAPTLFVGPPSRNASQLSISRTATHDSRHARDPLQRQKSTLSRPVHADSPTAGSDGDTAQESHVKAPKLNKASDKEVEARWKEMQSTLNEVELTAQSSTHVFGERHTAALDELRKAQVELARAWGRGNEDKPDGVQSDFEKQIDRFEEAEDMAANRQPTRKRGDTNASASTALSDESGRSDFTTRSGGGRSLLEDETALDIKLATERRAANEAYFQKVDRGVKDVVAKLEVVAEAMRSVEGESRSLWSNSDRSLMSAEDASLSAARTTSGKGEKEGRKGESSG